MTRPAPARANSPAETRVGTPTAAQAHTGTTADARAHAQGTFEPRAGEGRAPDGVAYLVSRYPALSHTFIEREVAGLRAAGVRVETFTVRPTPSEQLITDGLRAEAEHTTALIGDPRLRRTVWRAHVRLLRENPGAWFAGLARALRTGPRSPKARLWQVFYFLEAVVLLHHLRARGLRHVHAHFVNVGSDVARHTAALGADVEGEQAGWRWSFTMHGPTGFDAVEAVDLAAKTRDADGVSCITDFCRSQLMTLVEPEHWPKLQVVHMSVDADTYHPPAAPRGHDGPLRLLDVGRLVPAKGPSILLDAIESLRERGVEVDARIVGAGPLRDDLAAAVRDRGLTEVTLTGPLGQDFLPELYRWADVFVLPSFSEGLPVVLMEAMATGLPVVTTQIAGVNELVTDGVHGAVVPAGRAERLADAIATLAADPDLRARLGAAGREAVLAGFTPETTAPAAARFLQAAQGAAR